MAKRQTLFWQRLIILLVVLSMLLGPVASAGVFQTIGDFLSLGANTVRELQKAIQEAGGEVRATLEELDGILGDLLDDLQKTYQDNLNITLDSVDALTRNKLLEVESLMLNVNEILQGDITQIGDEAKSVIQDATLRLRTLSSDIKSDLQDVVIVAGETGVFLDQPHRREYRHHRLGDFVGHRHHRLRRSAAAGGVQSQRLRGHSGLRSGADLHGLLWRAGARCPSSAAW